MGRVAGPGLSPLAHDFAPDLLTLQESPPSNPPRVAVLGVVVLLGALLAWAFWAKLDVVATAQGRLVPVSFTKVVQPGEPGVVTQILVRDGDAVTAGQVLLRLDSRLSQADASTLEADGLIKRLTIARIDAELAGRTFMLPSKIPSHIAKQVQAQFEARRQSLSDAVAQDRAALEKVQAELASAQQTLIKLRDVLPIVQSMADRHERLEKDGFISSMAVADKQRELIEKSRELQAQIETVNALKAASAQQTSKMDAVRSTYRTQLENERLEAMAQLSRIDQDVQKTSVRAGMLEVRSPADGVVKDLSVTAPGAVVQAGALLMNVVPRNEPVQAEVLLSTEDAGFVATGQKAQIKVGAYPFQKYGLLAGTVQLIAADTTDNRQATGAPQVPTFRALIKLSEQHLLSPSGERLALSPGMLVVAEVHQGKRTVMEYLLSPVQKVTMEAGRER